MRTITVPAKEGAIDLCVEADATRHFAVTRWAGARRSDSYSLTHLLSGAVAAKHSRKAPLVKLATQLEALAATAKQDDLWEFRGRSGPKRAAALALAGPVVAAWKATSEDHLRVTTRGDKVVVTNAKERARRGLGSMLELGLASEVPRCNALDRNELLAVLLARQWCPFPLGDEDEVYRRALDGLRSGYCVLERAAACPTADLRLAITMDAARGCNGPTDTYTRAAERARKG